jgi:hypothetical protein
MTGPDFRNSTKPAEFSKRMEKLQAHIEPPSAGWLGIKLTGPGGEAEFDASYTPRDTFLDLAHGIATLYRYGHDQTITINEERSDEIELVLSKQGDKLVLQIKGNGAAPTRIECDFESGCRQFALRLKQTLEETGGEAFAREWRHPPPHREVTQLWSYFSGKSRRRRPQARNP